ncbi:MAG TPA: UDP-3-O-(3-hydroxymyristoyl)glucosamine N-acyltransferase [Gemmatimonadales bacterium]|nr:UDP-3-O-(3-hydroxymyristoyl)glucosamine N-acyltransferase [Gemmatimonadales bacterium]
MTGPALTAQAVADLVGGRLVGPGEVLLRRVRALDRAESDALAHCAGARWRDAMAASAAGAVLVPASLADAPGPATRIVVADPARAIARVAARLHPPPVCNPGIDPTAQVAPDARLGADVVVGPFVVIGSGVTLGDRVRLGPRVVLEAGVQVGDDTRLDAHVVVHHGAVLGRRVHCKSGAVIGGDGFGFVSGADGHERVPQVGGCILEDDVEVGSNSCIDRGSLDDTRIGRGTKLDNLVHVGHNVQLGAHCLLMAGVGISGSTRIGDRVILAGQSGVGGHLTIGDDARVAAQAGVIASVEPGQAVSGFPARPHREFLRAQAAMYRLAPHVKALEALANEETENA